MQLDGRGAVVLAVRQRVENALVCTMAHATSTAIAASLAAMTARDSQPVFDVLFNIPHARRAGENRASIAMTGAEFETLFGINAPLAQHDRILSGAGTGAGADPATAALFENLERALRCTLVEQRAREVWARFATKLVCHLALHMPDAEARVGACLGGIVRGDSRRLDELISHIEDNEADHMLLVNVCTALGVAACE